MHISRIILLLIVIFLGAGVWMVWNQKQEEAVIEENGNTQIDETVGSPSCENICGNNVCDEVVCQMIGCPCAETPASCPEDCGQEMTL